MSRSYKKQTAGAYPGDSNKWFKTISNRKYRHRANTLVRTGRWDQIPGYRIISEIYDSVTEGYGWWRCGDEAELKKWSRK